MNRRSLPFLILALLVLSGAGAIGVVQAQVTPYPVTLTMSGPATAVSGQEITYRLHYQLAAPTSTAIVITITEGATYVSSQVTSGPDGSLDNQSERRVWWGLFASAEDTEGEIEFVVRADNDFVGSIFGDAYIPGTETTSSNAVETQVFAPDMLPQAGGGGPVADSLLPLTLMLMMLVGVALLCAGAATHVIRRIS